MYKNIFIYLLIFFVFIPQLGITQKKNITKIKTALNNRFDKSAIKPKKHILSLLASNNQYPIILQSPSAFLKQNVTQGFSKVNPIDALYINYQYTLNHDFFVEGGFKYLNYWTGYSGNLALMTGGRISEFRSAFATYSFDFGTGYRVIVNNNINLFNIHTGLSLGITDHKVGTAGGFYYSNQYIDGDGNIGIFEIDNFYIIKNRANLGFYIGFSKDIRLTENLYLTARYNNHFGRNNIISENIIRYSLSTYGIVNEVKANLTAKGKMYGIGLRWIF